MKKWMLETVQAAVIIVLAGVCIGGGVALGFAAMMQLIW